MAVRTDKLQATYAGNLESVVLSVDVENGAVTTIGALVDGEREIVQGGAPVDVLTDEILLIKSPEVLYEKDKGILDFINKANKPARAYHYAVGDIVTVTDTVITGTSVKDKYLIPENGSNKLKAANDLTGKTRFAAQVIWKGKLFGVASTAYKVLKH